MTSPSPAPTPVGAPGWLAEVRNRILVVASGHATAGEIEAAIKDEWVLAAALEAVLKAHRITRGVGRDGIARCAWCRDGYGERVVWPCGEILAIEAALRDAQGGAR